jgi:hypothetical protein
MDLTTLPTESWLYAIFSFLSSAKGLTAMGVAVGLTQLVMMYLRTPLANFSGRWRLSLVALFTVFHVVLTGLAAGLPLQGALAQAPVLTAVQVLLNQVWKQFFEKES